jgi:predicted nucleic acid-binding protein
MNTWRHQLPFSDSHGKFVISHFVHLLRNSRVARLWRSTRAAISIGRRAPIRRPIPVTTITLAEVLTGPLQSSDEVLTRRYRAILESWQIVDLNTDIAESAARLRASLHLKLPDAVQAATALAINADALVTHDRDFSRLKSLRVIS